MAGGTTAAAIWKLNRILAVLKKRCSFSIGRSPFFLVFRGETWIWKNTLLRRSSACVCVVCLCSEVPVRSVPLPQEGLSWAFALLSHYRGEFIQDQTAGVHIRSHSSLIHCWGLPDTSTGPILCDEKGRPILVNRLVRLVE